MKSLRMSQIQSTYKSVETEEFLDVYFYRPIGYVFAVVSRSLRLTPNAVTFIGACIGIIGGHLLYYDSMKVNLIGILLLLICESMDSADGQLARMTGQFSRAGRILDGVGDNLKFVSIYVHVTLRIIGSSSNWWLFGIALVSGLSHSTQSAIADYFRTSYLHYVVDPTKGDIESLETVESRYQSLSWRHSFFDKLVGRLYLNYTRQQNFFVGTYRKLFFRCTALYGQSIPAWFREHYRNLNQSQIKYYNILTTNTRMIVLFIAVISQQLWLYFSFELTVLNLLLVYVLWKQRTIGIALWNTVGTYPERQEL